MVAKAKANLYDSRCPIRRIAASDFRSLISWLYCEHGAQWKQNLFEQDLIPPRARSYPVNKQTNLFELAICMPDDGASMNRDRVQIYKLRRTCCYIGVLV